MKVIPKLLDGGFMSLFTQYTPVLSLTPSQPTRSSSSKGERSSEGEESTKGKLTEKDLFELVSKVDGLPNDTRALVNSLSDMFLILLLTGNTDISNLASTYLANLYLIKIASFNKKEYDKVYTLVTKNGGLNEYAITDSGQVVVLDNENNLQLVDVSELLNNTDKYKPLTNSNLLYLRAYLPEYVNNNQILNTVANGIGIELIDKMIRERLSSLGTSETIRSGYSVKANSYIFLGLDVLSLAESAAIAGLAGMTLDGMYKNKIITRDLKLQAEAALQYIYNTLPNNAKTLLSIKAGNASDPQKGALSVIFQLITSRMNQTNSSETTWEGTLNEVTKGKGTSGSNGSSSDDIRTDPYYNITRGWGGEDGSINIKTSAGADLSVNGTIYSSIPNKEGEPIGRTSLEDALQSGLLGINTDPLAITFGNIPLTSDDFLNIVFDGLSGGTLVPLPFKITANGTKMANIDILDQWEEANRLFKERGIDILDPNNAREHAQEITLILYSNLLDGLVSIADGGIDYSLLGLFLIVDGYAVARNGDDRFNSDYVDYLPSVDDQTELMIIRTLSTNNDRNNYLLDLGGFSWNNDNVYRGSIYIPITNNLLKGLTASGLHIKEGSAMEKEYEYLMFLKRQLARQPNPGIL